MGFNPIIAGKGKPGKNAFLGDQLCSSENTGER